jgi:phosphate:Na+ symporter
MLFHVFGGVGLFLLGMVILTDGLKAFAGESLRQALVRFTGTPLKAFASGALITVMVQSSSATTVTLIGFVSAGLLTFPQAVGVVLGASLGTTGTGWLVAGLGLKVSLGNYALLLVGGGAFLKLLARGRLKSLGLALAGFGLIFVGIDTLQQGMQTLSTVFSPSTLPGGGIGADLLTMAVGAGMTIIMQSSSAAVATTLTALHTGTIDFERAAALVIGAAVGTTVTGALAVIGGSVPAKRTALAHVLFNLSTAVVALLLLPALLWGIGQAQVYLLLEPGALSLAAFHTAFIGIGVTLFLPFVDAFARGIERLVPDTGPRLTRHLDDTLLQAPGVALEATRRALVETALETFETMRDVAAGRTEVGDEDRRAQIVEALDETQRFFARISSPADNEVLADTRVAQMHAMDHLLRLRSRLTPSAGVRRMLRHDRLQPPAAVAQRALTLAIDGLQGTAPPDWLATLERLAAELAELRREDRLTLLRQASAAGGPLQALEATDAVRWLERTGYHAWRACSYLTHGTLPDAPAPEEAPDAAPSLASS